MYMIRKWSSFQSIFLINIVISFSQNGPRKRYSFWRTSKLQKRTTSYTKCEDGHCLGSLSFLLMKIFNTSNIITNINSIIKATKTVCLTSSEKTGSNSPPDMMNLILSLIISYQVRVELIFPIVGGFIYRSASLSLLPCSKVGQR
jgi:hypothetical protein